MTSEKSVYWVAVALMAVFVGNHFAKKYEHSCIADRAIAAIQHLSSEADDFDSMTQPLFDGNFGFSAPRLAISRRQGQFAVMEADLARQKVACSRIQAQRARVMALEQMQRMRARCPRQTMTFEIRNHPDGTI